MKKLILTAFMAAFAFTAFAGDTKNDGKKCDPAACKNKACCDKADKKVCKDGKDCKDKKACEGMKKDEAPKA